MDELLVSQAFRTALHVTGRVLFAMIFVMTGMNHFMKLEKMSAYAAAKGVPAAKGATVVGGFMILVGGVFVLIGWHRFIGAGLLAPFLFGTAFLIHPFWKETKPNARANEMAHFLKDLSLAGAALLVAFFSGTHWPASLGG